VGAIRDRALARPACVDGGRTAVDDVPARPRVGSASARAQAESDPSRLPRVRGAYERLRAAATAAAALSLGGAPFRSIRSLRKDRECSLGVSPREGLVEPAHYFNVLSRHRLSVDALADTRRDQRSRLP